VSQQINLFNPIFLKQKKVFSSIAMAEALGLLLAGALALAWYGQRNVAALQRDASAGAQQLVRKQARLAKVSAEFAPRQRNRELEAELAQAEAELGAMRGVSGVLERGELGNTEGYAEYFRALARQNLRGLWLTGVSIGAAGHEIGVKGRALDPTLVPAYLSRLAHERIMQGKTFGSLQIGQAEPNKNDGKQAAAPAPYVEFSLQSTLAGADK
jgi:hypothetical protein